MPILNSRAARKPSYSQWMFALRSSLTCQIENFGQREATKKDCHKEAEEAQNSAIHFVLFVLLCGFV
jgi:hypothetical protein